MAAQQTTREWKPGDRIILDGLPDHVMIVRRRYTTWYGAKRISCVWDSPGVGRRFARFDPADPHLLPAPEEGERA